MKRSRHVIAPHRSRGHGPDAFEWDDPAPRLGRTVRRTAEWDEWLPAAEICHDCMAMSCERHRVDVQDYQRQLMRITKRQRTLVEPDAFQVWW